MLRPLRLVNRDKALPVRWLAVILLVIMLVGMFVGGAQPIAVGLFPAPWDKLAHASFFFIFAFLLSRYVSLPIVSVIVLAMLVGAADEIHQSFLPGRVAGWDDWLADVVGAAMGLICVFLLGRRKSQVE